MDELWCELFGVDSSAAFNFFLSGLKEVSGKRAGDEMYYVASVLAHYSMTSRYDASSMPTLADLTEVFDQFVLIQTNDSKILEAGGSQVLLFAGFFRDQMKFRHNVNWYDQVGQSFYDRASLHSREVRKRQLFEGLSESFPKWTLVCRDLSRVCRDNRFLLRIN